ncbi:MAG: N-acetyltransferase [Muribaculaceae bacterium]|nr:N-acetyltransferase [Muribaculaceae bacterium]MDE5972941.1 N-acetyltransferase [Muribaculaceae bacterium]MDE6462597.1 N-acetyltransferase [Muribaculaceae bacterium]
MSVEIKQIPLKRGPLRRFVKFGVDLYRDNPCHVPPLILDDVNTLLPSKNPAFDFCQAAAFMAYRDGKPVGRIAAIINTAVNARTGQKEMRFGFVDFIDDNEVVDALFAAAADWGRAHGMTTMLGPMGFTDMDHEGMLVDGFDEMGTMATIYNHPYYPRQLERMGFKPEAEWLEFRMEVPAEVPEKMKRIAALVKAKYGLQCITFTSRKALKEEFGQPLFELINRAYDKLYGYSPLTQRQIDYYIGLYLGLIRLDTVCVIADKDRKIQGIGISIPSFSKALRKARGRLFPFGWIPLLKALTAKKGNDVVDLLLVAVSPEYQNKGVNALLFEQLIPVYNRYGYKWAESNPELASNANVQAQWQYFNHRQHRRRQAFRRDI